MLGHASHLLAFNIHCCWFSFVFGVFIFKTVSTKTGVVKKFGTLPPMLSWSTYSMSKVSSPVRREQVGFGPSVPLRARQHVELRTTDHARATRQVLETVQEQLISWRDAQRLLRLPVLPVPAKSQAICRFEVFNFVQHVHLLDLRIPLLPLFQVDNVPSEYSTEKRRVTDERPLHARSEPKYRRTQSEEVLDLVDLLDCAARVFSLAFSSCRRRSRAQPD